MGDRLTDERIAEIRDRLRREPCGLRWVRRDALARVSLANGPPTLIALGAREPGALPVRQSVAVLAFLGRAVGAALSR